MGTPRSIGGQIVYRLQQNNRKINELTLNEEKSKIMRITQTARRCYDLE